MSSPPETRHLKLSYSLLAPFYDLLIGPLLAAARAASLARLPRSGNLAVLIDGIGTGLDLPHLPPAHRYVGLDLTHAMLRRARPRIGNRDVTLVQGDSQRLPFRDASFDYVVMHLILAVVPDGAAVLREAGRVLKPGGRALVFDKFLRRGQRAPLRRVLSPLASRLATRLDVVFEEIGAQAPELAVAADTPILARGWFRLIELEKTAARA